MTSLTWEEAVSSILRDPSMAHVAQECYYDLPEAAGRYWESDEWKTIRTLLPVPPSGRALDVGAGNGIVSHARAQDGWTVFSIEPDESDIVGAGSISRLKKEKALDIHVVRQFGEYLPFPNDTFDVIVARQVLHHASDLPKFLAEQARVLKPGGTFLSVRDHVIAWQGQKQKFLDNHPLHSLYGGENAYLRREYRRALSDVFHVQEVFDSVASSLHLASRDKVIERLSQKVQRLPGHRSLVAPLRNDFVMSAVLRLAGRLDIRPGRAISFLCTK